MLIYIFIILLTSSTVLGATGDGSCGWTVAEMIDICDVSEGVCTSNFLNSDPVIDSNASDYRLNYVGNIISLHDQASAAFANGDDVSVIKDYRFTSAVMAGLDGACSSTLYTQMAEDMRFAYRMIDDEETLATRGLETNEISIPHIKFTLQDTCAAETGGSCENMMPESLYNNIPENPMPTDWTDRAKLDGLAYGVDQNSVRDTQTYRSPDMALTQTFSYQIFTQNTSFDRLNFGDISQPPDICFQADCAAADVNPGQFKFTVASAMGSDYLSDLFDSGDAQAIRLVFDIEFVHVDLARGDTIEVLDTSSSSGGTYSFSLRVGSSYYDTISSGSSDESSLGAYTNDTLYLEFASDFLYGSYYRDNNYGDHFTDVISKPAVISVSALTETHYRVNVDLTVDSDIIAYCNDNTGNVPDDASEPTMCMILYDPYISLNGLAPPVDPPDLTVLTLTNLLDHPIVLMPLGILTLIFVALAIFASYLDTNMDKQTIAFLLKRLQSQVNQKDLEKSSSAASPVEKVGETGGGELVSTDKEQKPLDTVASTPERILHKLLLVHPWLSVFKRHPCDACSSVDHVMMVYTALLSSAATSIVLTAQEDDPRSDLHIYLLIGFYSGLVSLLIGKILRMTFPRRNNRFDKTFVRVVEDIAIKKGYQRIKRTGKLHQQLYYEKKYLQETFGIENSLTLKLAGKVITEEHDEFTLDPGFWDSDIPEVVIQGFALAATEATEAMVQHKWVHLHDDRHWYTPTKHKVGYCIVILLCAAFWTIILAHMMEMILEFSYAEFEFYYETYALSMVYDAFVMGPLSCAGKFLFILALHRFFFPRVFS